MSSIWTIRRSATDSKLTGLCGGVARHWGIDPVLVRVGAVLLALSGGIGVVLYIAGWLLLPTEGKDKALVDDLFGGQIKKWPRELRIAIVVIACVVVVAFLAPLIPFSIFPALVLGAIWYFGYYRNRPAKRDGTSEDEAPFPEPVEGPSAPAAPLVDYPGPPTAFTEAAKAWQQRVQQNLSTQQPSPPQAKPAPAARSDAYSEPDDPAGSLPPVGPGFDQAAFLAAPDPVGIYDDPAPIVVVPAKKVRQSSLRSAKRLRLVSLIVFGLTMAGLGTASAVGVAVPLAIYFSAALMVIALTLVAAAWCGRPRGLIALAVVALLGTLITSAAPAEYSGPEAWGSSVSYIDATAMPSGDNLDVGQLEVDLSQLKFASDTSYSASVDAGTLLVKLPPDANVNIQWTIDAGSIETFDGSSQAGTELSGKIVQQGRDPDGPTLNLTLSIDVGQLKVER